MIAGSATAYTGGSGALASILRRRRGLIFSTAALGTALVCAAAFLIPPQYTAKAQVVVDPQLSSLIGEHTTVIDKPTDEPALLTELLAVSSHNHLQHVLDNLAMDPAFHSLVSKTRNESNTLSDRAWLTLSDWIPRSWIAAISGPAWLTLRQLERHLKVFQELGSHIIAITYTSSSPQEAAAIANRVTQLFVEREAVQQRASLDSALAWFDRRIPELNEKVEQLETKVAQYQNAQGLGDTSRVAVVDQNLADLNRQLSTAQAELVARKARYESVRALQARGTTMQGMLEFVDTPTLSDLRHNETALLQTYANLSVAFSASNPRMEQIRGQLQAVRQDMARGVQAAIAGLASEEQLAAARVDTIRQQLTALQHASTDLNLRGLERESVTTRRLYESLTQRREELRAQREGLTSSVRLLSLAAPPDRPSSPPPFLFIPPALVLFSICGALAAVLVDRLDVSLRSERDVAESLGIPCIGLVPQLRRMGRKRPHQFLLEKPFAPYSEAIRSVAAGLQLTTPHSDTRVILVTSSLPGEGKTTLAVSLAVYAAQLRRRVLLIDLDFRHPAILRELGGKADAGILDLLLQKRPTADYIKHLPNLRLDCLPVRGGLGVDPVTLFATEQLPRLLHQLRATYDCIVIDSAPLLAITETRLLAPLADKVVLAVKWASTRSEVAENALGLLRKTPLFAGPSPERVLAVLTQADLKKHARYRYGDAGEFLVEYASYSGKAADGGKLPAPARGEQAGREWPR